MESVKQMREVFGDTLCDLGDEFADMVVLDADVSSSTQTWRFGERYPDRFFNFGIAEANMTGAAAGMAAAGLIPVVSTFAFLITLRAGDPVRSLIAYNSLNVKLAGGYAGLSDFADGASHQAVIDLAIMRAMPNMTVLVPSDVETTRGAVRAMLEYNGPVYLRLSRGPVGSLHGGVEQFEIGRANVLKRGQHVTLAVSGTLLSDCLKAAEELGRHGIDAAVVEFPSLKPFDAATLNTLAAKTGRVVSVEEHSVIGGLGGAAAECLAEAGCSAQLMRIGLNDCFGESGPYDQLLDKYRLSAPHIVKRTLDWINTDGAEP